MIRQALDKLYLWAGYAAGAFLVAIFVLMMLLSSGRPIGFNIPAGDDLVSWCMVATSFLGLAHTFRHGEMIRVGLLIDRLEGRTRHWFEVAALLIGGCFVAFFFYYAAQMTYFSWKFNDMAQGVLAVPLWIPQLGYSGGLGILLIAFIDEFIHVIRGNTPRYEKPKPKTAEEAIEQAIQSAV
ncbi:MAG: TRAP transporter small permease [Pseudolabrys sp.]|nr:TRAP transporter small permease [Pseudolabrys sp.]